MEEEVKRLLEWVEDMEEELLSEKAEGEDLRIETEEDREQELRM